MLRPHCIKYCMMKFYLLLLACLGLASGETRIGNPKVTIAQGTVEGKSVSTARTDVDRFIAIPYAKPPVNELRYQPPVPHAGWGDSTFDATTAVDENLDTKVCLQQIIDGRALGSTVGTEDCLFINVWVGGGGVKDALASPLPVMVFIHGGGYTVGSSWGRMVWGERLFDMIEIAGRGSVVAVSFNYRLGPLGFLSTGDDAAPGNNGMLDQVLALEWIRNNIGQFGGDVNSVTLFGQGTGASSVSLQMMSPKTDGYFHRAILQSGTAIANFAVVENPYISALELSTSLNCPANISTTEMMACIRASSVHDVVTGVPITSTGGRKTSNVQFAWGPVVNENFLPSRPEALLYKLNDYDTLLGSNSMDGHMFAAADFPLMSVSFIALFPFTLTRAACMLQEGMPRQVSRVAEYQYKDYSDSTDAIFTKVALTHMYTDAMFVAPLYTTAMKHTRESAKSTFVYVFKEEHFVVGPINPFVTAPGWLEADFGAELQWVFDMPDRDLLHYSNKDEDIARLFVAYWTNFAWSGHPNQGPNSNSGMYWPEYTADSQLYLTINKDMLDSSVNPVGAAYRGDYVAFWTGMIPQLWGSSYGVCSTERGILPPIPLPTPNVDIGCELEITKNQVVEATKQTLKFLWNQIKPDISRPTLPRPDPPGPLGPGDEIEEEEEETVAAYSMPSQRGSFYPDCESTDIYARQTNYGCVQGKYTTWQGKLLSQYFGIPYAKKPARFESPEQPDPWTGVRDATSYSKICPQYPYNADSMDEDCLYLNLYVPVDSMVTPGVVVENRYAVMIWIHGGSYMTGDGMESYIADVLSLQGPVIVVTFNYRLGSLGFMSTENRYSPGNYGLRDQYMAIEWVRDNIYYFGGDPSRITLFGHGAGSESVQLHTLSTESENMNVTQVILQSGTGLSITSEYPDQHSEAVTLATNVGCTTLSDKDMVTCIKNVPTEELINAQASLQFAPVVDGSYIRRDPAQTLNVRSVSGWNYMIGATTGDATTYWDKISSVTNGDQFKQLIKDDFETKYGFKSDDIELHYTNWNNPDFANNQEEIQRNLFDLYLDYRYLGPSYLTANEATGSSDNVFVYNFNYMNQDVTPSSYPSWTGVPHGGELPYVWGTVLQQQTESNAYYLSYDMMEYWTNFAQTGNPTIDEDGYKSDLKWPEYTLRKRRSIQFDTQLSTTSYVHGKNVVFWNHVLGKTDVSCPIVGL